jgi:hypothetical protein
MVCRRCGAKNLPGEVKCRKCHGSITLVQAVPGSAEQQPRTVEEPASTVTANAKESGVGGGPADKEEQYWMDRLQRLDVGPGKFRKLQRESRKEHGPGVSLHDTVW